MKLAGTGLDPAPDGNLRVLRVSASELWFHEPRTGRARVLHSCRRVPGIDQGVATGNLPKGVQRASATQPLCNLAKMSNPNILVVDDEPDISALVAYHLARESYRVRTAASGPEALRALETDVPDLIVLDLMLPGLSGLDVLREIRRQEAWREVPVILLTAKREESDRLEGLRLGADDYVSKPFSPQEVVLRVGAVLRRVQQQPPNRAGKQLRIGPFTMDVDGKRAEVAGRELDLTPTEFRLLQVLMERRGRVQSRRQLLESVWEVTARITTRTVDMHVQRLRGKAGDAADWIETVRGFGYRFRTDPPA